MLLSPFNSFPSVCDKNKSQIIYFRLCVSQSTMFKFRSHFQQIQKFFLSAHKNTKKTNQRRQAGKGMQTCQQPVRSRARAGWCCWEARACASQREARCRACWLSTAPRSACACPAPRRATAAASSPHQTTWRRTASTRRKSRRGARCARLPT